LSKITKQLAKLPSHTYVPLMVTARTPLLQQQPAWYYKQIPIALPFYSDTRQARQNSACVNYLALRLSGNACIHIHRVKNRMDRVDRFVIVAQLVILFILLVLLVIILRLPLPFC